MNMYVTASAAAESTIGGAMVGAQPKGSRLQTPTSGESYTELHQVMSCTICIPQEKVFIV